MTQLLSRTHNNPCEVLQHSNLEMSKANVAEGFDTIGHAYIKAPFSCFELLYFDCRGVCGMGPLITPASTLHAAKKLWMHWTSRNCSRTARLSPPDTGSPCFRFVMDLSSGIPIWLWFVIHQQNLRPPAQAQQRMNQDNHLLALFHDKHNCKQDLPSADMSFSRGGNKILPHLSEEKKSLSLWFSAEQHAGWCWGGYSTKPYLANWQPFTLHLNLRTKNPFSLPAETTMILMMRTSFS